MWDENDTSRKSAWSVLCFAHGDCLPFAFVAKIWCKHRAFHSFCEKEICFVLGKMTMKLAEIFRIDCFKPVNILFLRLFHHCSNLYIKMSCVFLIFRDTSTLVQKCSFFSRTAFLHKVWPIQLKSLNNFDVGYQSCSNR